MLKKFENLAVIIPAYMPSGELLMLVNSLLSERFLRIVVIDDGSGRDFSCVFDALPSAVVLLRHDENKGKGAALKTGFTYIYENCSDCFGIITCDADGQHRPGDIYKVAEALGRQGGTPVAVLGSRSFKGKVPPRSAFGNTVTRGVYFLASGVRLRDTQTGLRAFPYGMLPMLLAIPGDRYEYEINMLLEIAKQKIRIIEVAIETVYLDENKSSHFHTLRDSVRIYENIIKFSFSSLACFFIDFIALFFFRYLTQGQDEEIALLISVACARALSSCVNFWLNRHIVFKRGGKHTIFRYYSLALFVLGMNYGLLYLLNLLMGVQLFWSKLLVEAALFILSYTVQRRFIFTGKGVAGQNGKKEADAGTGAPPH